MNETASTIFISYATADRAEALKVCKEIERRGTRCWISTRDVPPGANYQEAIVQALRAARAMVLVFTEAANSSNEIKKELSLASRYRVPVITLRLKDVEPSDAFAYELSTRQWIDAFEGWDKSIDSLVGRIAELSNPDTAAPATAPSAPSRATNPRSRVMAGVVAGVLALCVAAGLWWGRRPPEAAAHGMTVRLAGFQLLSTDLPATLRESVDSEISAAFNADGVVGVSSAPAAESGSAPAFALGGTIQRDGPSIRVITRMVNERSGATLWTNTFDYDGNEVARIPRHIAVDAGNVVRCGLFGASTYRKPLPDTVLRDYLQFCQGHWDPHLSDGRKALVPAQRVVEALPDFSWGWAAVAGGYWKVALSAENERLSDEARAMGRQAADRAVAIDPRNSEALYIKAVLLDRRDWLGKEDLYKRAVGARRLDCGCEYHQYGWMLLSVGRTAEAVEHLRHANDMLALYVYTPLTLANALAIAGNTEEARRFYDAATDLAPDAKFAKRFMMFKAFWTDDGALLQDPALQMSDEVRAALLKGYRALASGDAAAKAQAVQTLVALTDNRHSDTVATLLGRLGANREAFQLASQVAKTWEFPGPALLWDQRLRAILDDPGMPAVLTEVGLMNYWKTTHTKPDVCEKNPAPAFCGMI